MQGSVEAGTMTIHHLTAFIALFSRRTDEHTEHSALQRGGVAEAAACSISHSSPIPSTKARGSVCQDETALPAFMFAVAQVASPSPAIERNELDVCDFLEIIHLCR
jgi:hypothetical protein